AEARSHHHRGFYPAPRALLDRLDGRIARKRHNGRLRRIGHIGQRRIGFETLDLGAFGVDGIDRAFEAMAGQIQQRASAYLVLVLRCSYDRDGFRVQYGSQRVTQHVGHMALVMCWMWHFMARRTTTRFPQTGVPLTSPRVPPILFSFSDAPMTATDFGFSTVRNDSRNTSFIGTPYRFQPNAPNAGLWPAMRFSRNKESCARRAG